MRKFVPNQSPHWKEALTELRQLADHFRDRHAVEVLKRAYALVERTLNATLETEGEDWQVCFPARLARVASLKNLDSTVLAILRRGNDCRVAYDHPPYQSPSW